MVHSSQFSSSHPLISKSLIDAQEASSSSEDCPSCPVVHSDEEVLLATSCPKKRAGRRVFRETRHPVFRGVRKRNGNKWVCEIRETNKKTRIWLGTYPTPEMAARAHDVAALALRGKSACLNFADSCWRLPVLVSRDAKDIRRAAKDAAELFRPQEFGGHRQVGEQNISKKVVVVEDCSSEVYSDDHCLNISQEINNVFFDEAVFDMPGLLMDMAEGLLLPPPHHAWDSSFESFDDWDHYMESDSGFSLWSY